MTTRRNSTVRNKAAAGNHLDKRAQELEKVAETRKTEHGLLLNLQSELLFETDSAVRTDGAVAQLTQLGDILATGASSRTSTCPRPPGAAERSRTRASPGPRVPG